MAGTSYLRVYNQLKEQIHNGEYPIGSFLLPESALEQEFQVSRITIRKAIEMLAADGYVRKQSGVGTIVLNYRVTQNLNTLTSLTETLTQRGYDVTVTEISITVEPATQDMVRILGVRKNEKLAHVRRLVHVSGEPLGIIENYIPYHLVEGIEKDMEFKSLYRHLENRYKLHIEMSQDHIMAQNATREEAEVLQVPEGFALICVNRLCLNSGKAVIYDTLRLRHDKYGYDITLYNKERMS